MVDYSMDGELDWVVFYCWWWGGYMGGKGSSRCRGCIGSGGMWVWLSDMYCAFSVRGGGGGVFGKDLDILVYNWGNRRVFVQFLGFFLLVWLEFYSMF